MKTTSELTHREIMGALTLCFRELMSTDISNRNMPVIINRGKTAAAIVMAAHRQEMRELRRQSAVLSLKSLEQRKLK